MSKPPSQPACVAQAYVVFARYPRKLSPATVAWDDADPSIRDIVARVKATRLHDLDPDTLRQVWMNATSSAASFRHFLPRVLELTRAGAFGSLPEVCERLLDMQVGTWPTAERAAIAGCLAPWSEEASVIRVKAICEA